MSKELQKTRVVSEVTNVVAWAVLFSFGFVIITTYDVDKYLYYSIPFGIFGVAFATVYFANKELLLLEKEGVVRD